MALTESTMLPLGSQAPEFSLQATDGSTVSKSDFDEQTITGDVHLQPLPARDSSGQSNQISS